MKRELEQPPTPHFRVPIVVEAKRGVRFGDLVEFIPKEPTRSWIHRLRDWLIRILKAICRQFARLMPGGK